MASPYHFPPTGPAPIPAADPSFTGSADIAGGPLVPGPFRDDATAAMAGVTVGQSYVQAVTGHLRTRMS